MENDQKEVIQMEELKALVGRSLENSEEALKNVLWIKKYLKWQQLMSYVKLILIIGPIIIGLIYLPPLLKNYIDQLSSLYK